MGSLPYGPHPRDDTKGATPPLDSPMHCRKSDVRGKRPRRGPLLGKPAERLPRKKEAQRSKRSLTLAAG